MKTPEVYLQIAEETSLSMTTPTLWLAGLVLLYWWKDFLALLKKPKKNAVDWMLSGVVISFIGQIGDNLWWGVAWFFAYIGDAPNADWWFRHGVISNIFFRQGCGAIAAFCHVAAANRYIGKERGTDKSFYIMWSVVMAFATLLILRGL